MNWEKLIFVLMLSTIFSMLVASGYLIFSAIYTIRVDNAAGKLMESRGVWEKRVNFIYDATFGNKAREAIEREGR